MKQEDLPSQGQEAQEAPVKSEEEKSEGGAPPEPEAPHHPTGDDTQEGLPSQASASSNVAPAETKEENNQELPPTTPAGEGCLRNQSGACRSGGAGPRGPGAPGRP